MSHCFCNKKLSLVEYLKVHSYALKPLERYGMGGAARSGSLHCLGHFELRNLTGLVSSGGAV